MSLANHPAVLSGPPRASRIIEPIGLRALPGTERYMVEGAGAILILVEPGDRVRIVNDEGGQPCEIVATDVTGRVDAGMLGQPS